MKDKIETPEKTTLHIKEYLKRTGNVIKYIYAVLQKAEYVLYKKSEIEPIPNGKLHRSIEYNLRKTCA